MTSRILEMLENEISLLTQADHVNVVRLLGSTTLAIHPGGRHPALVMELCTGGKASTYCAQADLEPRCRSRKSTRATRSTSVAQSVDVQPSPPSADAAQMGNPCGEMSMCAGTEITNASGFKAAVALKCQPWSREWRSCS